MIKNVVLRSPVLTQSGYGVHSRQVAQWLLTKNINLSVATLPWGDTPWCIDSNRWNGLVGKLMRLSAPHQLPPGVKPDVSFQVQLPNEWDPTIANFNVGITAAVETDKCHPQWIEACNRMDLIIVPSQFTKNVLLNSGLLRTKIEVVPEAYNEHCCADKNSLPTMNLDLETKFNFLIFGQLTGNNPHNDRKNIYNTIKWLCEAFKNDPDVGIVLKTNHGRNSLIDRKITTDLFKKVISECRVGPNPKVKILHGDFYDNEIAAVYTETSIKALVTATRGEGFGLPILEAAASGLPVIATGWSGHMDFMSKGKFVNLSYKLVDVHKSRIDNRIFIEGSKWADVSEEEFKQKVIKFRNADSIPREWATELQKHVQKSNSLETVFKHYDECLKGIL